MERLPVQVSNVIYNAAEQCFEARVTVHDPDGPVTYACAINAPITMSFEDAAAGLTKQALRNHGRPGILRSFLAGLPKRAPMRAARPALRRGLPLGQYGFFRGRAA